MAITSQMVKELRTSTGAGMMDCKKALDETSGDMDAAVDWLRKKGLAAAAKKASRVASEGLVAVKTDGNVGAVIEVNSETDFVSRNDEFQGFVRTLAGIGTSCDSVEALMDMPYTGASHSVADELTAKIAKIGENMSVRRMAKLSVTNGVVVSYIHNAVADGMGKIGVLVGLESDADASVLEQLGRQIAMHIAATAPASLSEADLDPEYVARERKLLVDQAIQSGKPADIAEKMVEGRMKKFMKEVVLLEQVFVIELSLIHI